MGLHLDAWWPQLPQGLAVLCPRALACLLSFLPARRCILLTLVQAVARTLCPWALGSGVSGFVVGPGGCCLWLPLTLVSPSVCFCFVFSLPLLHACRLPCSSLPPFSPPFLTTPFSPCWFLGEAQVRTWKEMMALRSDPTSCRPS